MSRKPNLLVVLAVFTLVILLAKDEAAAQAIAVTPANPTISVGRTQQFTATGVGGATAIDLGSFHSCALLQDGSVRCWGQNDLGQLGNGTTNDSATPVTVVGITGAAAVRAGGFHTCARFPDGTVQCWGRNSNGQLGDPAFTAYQSPTPVRVAGLTATVVSAGGFHNCALPGDRTVQCWGHNGFGQLGNGTGDPDFLTQNRFQDGTSNPTPVTVSGITTAAAVSAGGWHTCALLQDGTVRCWGDNTWGQLGDGAPVPGSPGPGREPPRRRSVVPVTVTGITTAVAIEAGIFHTCAILRDGPMQCWGRGEEGQLGNGSTANSSTPTTVPGIAPAILAPGAEFSCVLLPDGTVRCWGDNTWGQLGNDAPVFASTTPSGPVTGITTAIAASSGAEHSCALLPDGTVRCWGRNDDGRLGVATNANGTRPCTQSPSCAFTPVTVSGIGGVVRWTSSDTTVATIDASGLVTGGNPGSTTITATSGSRSGSTTLTVVSRPALSVIREGAGSGTVTSSPPGIDCGPTCSASYDRSTAVTLTATPATGSTFDGWTGGGCAGTTACTLTLTANTTVFARFGVTAGGTQFTLSVTRDGSGSGTVTSNPPGIDCGATCSAAFDSGTVVTLMATPATGSIFSGWSGSACSGTGPCTVTLTANTTIFARFTVSGSTTVNFDNPAPPGSTMSGVFQGIDFGTGQWQGSGPYNVNPTNHIYFADSTGTSRTFRFPPAPRVLDSIRVYSTTPGTLTLSDDAGQTFTRAVTTGSLQLVTTGWTRPSTTVTVSFTNGWDLGVDDITYGTAP